MTKRNPYHGIISILLEFLQRHKHQNNTIDQKVLYIIKVSVEVLLINLSFIIKRESVQFKMNKRGGKTIEKNFQEGLSL